MSSRESFVSHSSVGFSLNTDSKVYIAGHRGLVGSAIWRNLEAKGYTNLIGWSSSELDLRDFKLTLEAIKAVEPDVIILAAAKVGGIVANATHPVDFLNDNLQIQTSVFEAAHACKVSRLLFLGSSCIYPKFAEQPIKESSLLTGQLEETNKAYAIAKIAGVLQVQSYRKQYGHRWISAMPTNLYGPFDNFDLVSSHVLPALIRKLHEATIAGSSTVTLWGTGKPLREFLHTDDLANACAFLLENYDEDAPINVGWGKDISIADLAQLIAEIVGFNGQILWDHTKPDGTPRKVLNTTKINSLGWEPTISLRDGIESTYRWYLLQESVRS
jgi:GDP-L-fucose synthase